MTERSSFESRLAAAIGAYADRGPTDVDAMAMSHLAASAADTSRGDRWPHSLGSLPLVAVLTVAALLAAALIVGGLAAGAFRSPSPQLGVVPAAPLEPSAAPLLGGRIAFVRDGVDQNASTDIWVMNADGTSRMRLTDFASPDEHPVWSRDATRIAFTVGDTAAQIWVMDADGSNKRQVTDNAFPAGRPTWSPDGTSIAFASRGDLYVIGQDGSGLTRITHAPGGGDVDPAWSPQGDRIAFANGDSIYTVRPDGSARELFAQHLEATPPRSDAYGVMSIVRRPAWSPDGTRIAAMIGDADANSSIWLEDARGETRLTAGNAPSAGSPTWSPDGRWLAFVAFGDSDSYGDIYVVNADGSGLRDILSGASRDSQPAWSSN